MRGAVALCFILIFPAVLSTLSCRKEPIAIRHRPEVEIPDRWTASNVVDGEVMKQWWDSFQDPVLKTLIAEGLQSNYNLKAAAARLEVASAQVRIAGADFLPSVSTGLNARGQRQNFIGFPIPGSEGKVLSSTSGSFGVSLDASWEPDVWGRIKAVEA
ncbi:MAG: TolC family protein, partial [Acidobacteriota bacterium]